MENPMSLRTFLKEDWFLLVLGAAGLVGLGVVLAPCDKPFGTPASASPSATTQLERASGPLRVWDDNVNGVRCYYVEHGTTGTLSCVVLAVDAGPGGQ
jgi:hypothetical protein